MDKFFDVLLDSLVDTAKLLPVLLVVYFLIELLEYKNVFKFEKSKLLTGNASPVMGALFGTVPQCGFSVISSELYAKQKLSVGALVAVFIATSDEALPIMLSNYKAIPSLLMLVAVKLVMAIAIGYLTYFLYKRIFKNSTSKFVSLSETENEIHENHNHNDHENHEHDDKHSHKEHEEADKHNAEHEHIHACCHHDVETNKYNWKHPLIHSLKIALYIFVINVIVGTFVCIVGENNLANFLKSSYYFQPLLALLIGFIPNCASSVILTELYLMGNLSFGAIITGLSVNAGIGLIFLLKENKKPKENLFIILMLIIPSLIIGYALHFVPLDFLRI